MKNNKRNEIIKYAVLGVTAVTFYYRAELFNIIHPPDPAIPVIQSGARAYQKGDYKQAVALADNVLTQHPDSDKVRHAHLLKGMALEKLGNEKDASAELHAVTDHYAGTLEAKVANESLREIGAKATVKTTQTGPHCTLPGPDIDALKNIHAPGQFVGKWIPTQPVLLPPQGICTLTMEILAQEQGFTGYPELNCRPIPTAADFKSGDMTTAMQKMAFRSTPFSAQLSGAWDKDYRSLIFHTDQTTTTNGCPIAGDLKATPFGTSELAVTWKDSCGNNLQFMLRRDPNRRLP